jgi:hypothetical protein
MRYTAVSLSSPDEQDKWDYQLEARKDKDSKWVIVHTAKSDDSTGVQNLFVYMDELEDNGDKRTVAIDNAEAKGE